MSRRTERINHLLREEISQLLHRQVKDPRLGGLITVTRVCTSSDLQHAKVYISVMGDDMERHEALATLSSAAGFFHRELKGRLAMRHVPELSFHDDATVELGAQVLELIELTKTNSNECPGEY